MAGKLKKLARFLFHTGITRAKKVLVMVGTKCLSNRKGIMEYEFFGNI